MGLPQDRDRGTSLLLELELEPKPSTLNQNLQQLVELTPGERTINNFFLNKNNKIIKSKKIPYFLLDKKSLVGSGYLLKFAYLNQVFGAY